MSRRLALERVSFTNHFHLGLWLDKYLLSASKEDKKSKRNLVQEVSGGREPKEYPPFFNRYRKALEEVGAQIRTAKTRGRLVVGLGGEGVLETSITLHRTYGVPYIPGSALKGLVSRYAHLYLEGEAWRRNLKEFRRGEAQAALFGTTEEQGLVVFFDALPLPGQWKLHPDILNPHHRGYNAGEKVPPADWDSPIPVPFLSASGTFLLALAPAPGVPLQEAGPWLKATWQVLEWALREEGVGAKTSSGYGRMELEGEPAPRGQAGLRVQRLRPEVEDLLTRVRSLSYREVVGFLSNLAGNLDTFSPEEVRALREALEAKGLLKNPRDLWQRAKGDPKLQKVLERLGL